MSPPIQDDRIGATCSDAPTPQYTDRYTLACERTLVPCGFECPFRRYTRHLHAPAPHISTHLRSPEFHSTTPQMQYTGENFTSSPRKLLDDSRRQLISS